MGVTEGPMDASSLTHSVSRIETTLNSMIYGRDYGAFSWGNRVKLERSTADGKWWPYAPPAQYGMTVISFTLSLHRRGSSCHVPRDSAWVCTIFMTSTASFSHRWFMPLSKVTTNPCSWRIQISQKRCNVTTVFGIKFPYPRQNSPRLGEPRGGRTGIAGIAGGVGFRVNPILWDKRGDLRDCFWRYDNTSRWSLPPTINIGTLTGPGRGSETFPS